MQQSTKLFWVGLLLAATPALHCQVKNPAEATLSRKAERAARRAERAASPAATKPDYADLSYGPYSNNKLDLWLAKPPGPHPLMVFIHGGGFTGGDKRAANPTVIRRCLDAGVSFAAINYRFRTEVPIQTVLRDSARAIQFLRWKAKEFNLDKSRVAALGGSAGASTSLWLAFHPDLAEPRNPDPVLRESSRVSAAAATATQATCDVLKWKDILGDSAQQVTDGSDWPSFYGLKSMEELRSPKGEKIRADVDMLGLISKDDPPVFLIASSRHDALQNRGDVLHSSKHSTAVKKRCDEAGVPAVLQIDSDDQAGDHGKGGHIGFLLKHLGVQAR
jgi:acetyl esterase/lipase